MKVVQTHLSTVHLLEDTVYKVLKPVTFAFVDHASREQREHACRAEVQHNRPWAPGVYRGVVGVGVSDGQLSLKEPFNDVAIEMERLPDDRCLASFQGVIDEAAIRSVARRIGEVHRGLPKRRDSATPDKVRRRLWANLSELAALGDGLPAGLLRRVGGAMHRSFLLVETELMSRATSGQVLHGDLRAEHVYLLDRGVIILDGVAFDPGLAEGDPVEDLAFLAMDLTCTLSRWDLEAALWEGSGLTVSQALRDLYVAHRSLIRAKVALLQGRLDVAIRHVVFALGRLEPVMSRPALLAVAGLPGTGKSTLAEQLARCLHLDWVRSDVVRKELGRPPDYSDAGRARVYEVMFEQARALMTGGGRVVLDASFERQAWRDQLAQLGQALGVRPVLVVCVADPEVVEDRLRARVGDVSDADVPVYRKARDTWEEVQSTAACRVANISANGRLVQTLDAALDVLADHGVAHPALSPDDGCAALDAIPGD